MKKKVFKWKYASLTEDYYDVITCLSINGEAITPAFQCKDYYQDLFYSEYTGTAFGNKYGFSWKPKGILENEWFEIALKYKALAKDIHKDAWIIIRNLTELSERFKIPFDYDNSYENAFIVRMHRDWTLEPGRLSMFLGAARITYDKPLDEVLLTPRPSMAYLSETTDKQRFKQLAYNEIPSNLHWTDFEDVHQAHDRGWLYLLKLENNSETND